jgi:hypothetical protein
MRWIEITIINARSQRQCDAPKRHCRFGIQLRRSPERPLGFFVIEPEDQCESKIEESLRFRVLRGDRVMMLAQAEHQDRCL